MENEDLQATNDQFYQETAAPMGPSADLATPPDLPGPVGISLLSEDDSSFTISGPNGMATLPKDPVHAEVYNKAKGQAEMEAARAQVPLVASPVAPMPPVVAPVVQAPRQEPPDIVIPAPRPQMESAAPGPAMAVTTERTQNIFSPEDLKRQRMAVDAELAAKASEVDAKLAENDLAKLKADAQALETQKFIDQELQTRQAEEMALKSRFDALDQVKREFAGQTVDAERYWKNAPTGQKIMATVAMALSGINPAFMGNAGTQMWDMIEKNIDRDIDAQKFNINQKGRDLDAERTVYNDFLKATGDARVARLATKQMTMDKIAAEFEARLGAATNEAQKQALMAGLEGARAKAAEHGMELTKVVQTTRSAPLVGKEPKQLEDKTEKDMVNMETNLDEAASILDRLQSGKTGSGLIEGLKQDLSRASGGIIPADVDSAVLMADMAENRNKYVNLMFGASLTDTEKAAAEQAMPLFKDDPARAGAVLRSILDKAAERALRERRAMEYGKSVAPTQSTYLKTYAERKAAKSKK